CILRVGGTNCDAETTRSFQNLGVKAETVHLKTLVKKNNLLEYDILVFPGGFSFGDYVRAGAILAKTFVTRLGKKLEKFVEKGKPVIGICNGFQILVEAGLLPGFEFSDEFPDASLATNFPIGFKCCWIHLKHENKGKCVFTSKIPTGKVVRMPIAHGEGRFIFSTKKEEGCLQDLIKRDQIVFRYCNETGDPADGKYPTNPNGSFYDIAGICDPEGQVFGLMPHPERAYYGWQLPDWTKEKKMPKHSDGKLIFDSVIEYISNRI
ncbi:MAG: phosphoribosylformylglycinamidine synthase I, partial [Asgard group archaeon]|nr:phosphoribosylformylglycinamidine synthase I [Asgard group archaeon]